MTLLTCHNKSGADEILANRIMFVFELYTCL
jgi:hypothetical protein